MQTSKYSDEEKNLFYRFLNGEKELTTQEVENFWAYWTDEKLDMARSLSWI